MRVLVIGGAGYIGSHCCKEFSDKGWEVVTLDDLSRGWKDAVRWGGFIEGSILDMNTLDWVFPVVQPDVVAHLAAMTYVGESVSDPALYYRNNITGTMNVLDAMRKHGTKHIVFSSTAATYGVAGTEPVTEDHPQHPINPYGATKLAVERMLADYGRAYGITSLSLRFFNAAGAAGDIGERHEPETHLIPLAMQRLLQGKPFTVFGNDFDTPDGTAIRDYVHVSDIGRAHVLSAEYLLKGGATDALNLGTASGTSVAEVLSAIEDVSGRTIDKVYGPRREGDPPVLVASNAKAKTVLGWEPTQSSIHEIVESAWKWHQSNEIDGSMN